MFPLYCGFTSHIFYTDLTTLLPFCVLASNHWNIHAWCSLWTSTFPTVPPERSKVDRVNSIMGSIKTSRTNPLFRATNLFLALFQHKWVHYESYETASSIFCRWLWNGIVMYIILCYMLQRSFFESFMIASRVKLQIGPLHQMTTD
jgi:hypothetical protein